MSDFHFHITRDEVTMIMTDLAMHMISGGNFDHIATSIVVIGDQAGTPDGWSDGENRCFDIDAHELSPVLIALQNCLTLDKSINNTDEAALIRKLDEQSGGVLIPSMLAYAISEVRR